MFLEIAPTTKNFIPVLAVLVTSCTNMHSTTQGEYHLLSFQESNTWCNEWNQLAGSEESVEETYWLRFPITCHFNIPG